MSQGMARAKALWQEGLRCERASEGGGQSGWKAEGRGDGT